MVAKEAHDFHEFNESWEEDQNLFNIFIYI